MAISPAHINPTLQRTHRRKLLCPRGRSKSNRTRVCYARPGKTKLVEQKTPTLKIKPLKQPS